MSTNFVHLVGLFFGVFYLASLHQVHSMTLFDNTALKEEPINATKINVVNGNQHLSKRHESLVALAEPSAVRDRRYTYIRFNEVNGNQITSKKRESPVALAEPETVRDPRMTVIENQVVRGGQYYRPIRELLADGEKTLDRRATYIRFNEVNGNQHTSKKRESLVARTEPETVRDPRMTIIESPFLMGVPAVPTAVAPTLPSRGDFRPSQSFGLPQNLANPMMDPARAIPSSIGAQPQLASAPVASMADPNAPRLPLGAAPNIIKEMTVNGNQVLSKK